MNIGYWLSISLPQIFLAVLVVCRGTAGRGESADALLVRVLFAKSSGARPDCVGGRAAARRPVELPRVGESSFLYICEYMRVRPPAGPCMMRPYGRRPDADLARG